MKHLTTAVLIALVPALAAAAEITVFCPGAVRSVVTPLAEEYARASGNTVKFVYGTAGALAKRVASGEAADVVITTAESHAALAASGRTIAASVRELGKMGVGVAVRRGHPLPDIRTVESFKSAMLAARSITFADPAKGGQSGIHAAAVLEKLGIAKKLQPKIRLRAGGPEGLAEVARGDIEIGIAQISEILATRGVVLVGPLPDAIQNELAFSVALHARAAGNGAAEALIGHLVSASAKERFRSAGFKVE